MKLIEDELDYNILKNGSIVKYHNPIILDDDLKWFDKNNYNLIDINTSNWTSANFHQKVKSSLQFPEYYGENMNALIDCLGDMNNKRYKGLLIVLRNFESLSESDRLLSESFLDIISITSRRWLLENFYFICIVQSNDPDIVYNKLGGVQPLWNGDEFLDSNRRNKIIPPLHQGPAPDL